MEAITDTADPNPFGLENPKILDLAPPEPRSIEETGLKLNLLNDLVLKLLFYGGSMNGVNIAGELRLPWQGVVEHVIDFVAAEKLVDLRGGKGFGRTTTEFVLTEKGREFARGALERTTYTGAAPVPIEQYNALITAQHTETPLIDREELQLALGHLVVDMAMLERLGPAVNSGRSLFLYGPPGNGKTTLAEAISSCLGGEVYIPHALEIDGQIVKVYDVLAHSPVSLETGEGARRQTFEMDDRWMLCRRPSVVVGGELTLETLDLIYSESSRFYEAPFQIKSNGGMLLIDDFGRQKVHPTDLLNRWIVPLEKRVDYLTLHTGKKFEIPFDQLIVFSTNLDPKDLVDEAFLRRIRYKIEIGNPTEVQFRDIFRRLCESQGIPYHDAAVTYLLEGYYKPRGKELRCCHPRDLLHLISDAARFRKVPPQLSKDLLDTACRTFFIEM